MRTERDGMKNHLRVQDSYDTEIHCTQCGVRLYVPAIGVPAILDSLRRMGLAGLRCMCGHVQLIGIDGKPRPKPQTLNT